jgi:hypothetical protein
MSGLIGSNSLLEELFPEKKDRPSVRWLIGMRAKRLIPFYKLGGKVVFDVEEVGEAIEKNCHFRAISGK